MEQLGDWISASGLTRSEVARRAGVARTTLDRIQSGGVQPRLDTLADIAAACGLRLDVTAAPTADPAAAEAARLMLEAGYTPDDHTGTAVWVQRLARIAEPDTDPVGFLTAAARAARLSARTDTTTITGALTPVQVAAAGDGTHGDWALSGAPGLGLPGTIVLWAEGTDTAARLLSETAARATGGHQVDVIVVPAHPAVFTDAYTDGPLRLVAPIQIMLDSISLGGDLEAAALAEVARW